ncbi:MAG: PspC domain-containing protein [Flavobacteriaceae bacterium]|nr:PspC domain-containing protein [Flavobacteriaceae bacterium]
MNKTVNINLASTFFHIDESAYAKLKSYLKTLENGFKNTVGKEEILKDIEARIAELFQEIKTNSDYVISEADVDKIISVLGQPEDFITEEEEDFIQTEEPIRKKLFRDPDDNYIAGVASGLGHYFGIDASWIRLIWLFLVVFSGGTFITIYILFWILVPEAKTTVDKLKMKGKPVNISTIEKKNKEEFDEVSSKIKDIDYEKASNSLKKKSRNFFHFLEETLRAIPKVILKIFGILFLIISISTIITILTTGIVLLFFGTVLWPFDFLGFDLNPNVLGALSVFLFILIPFLFLFSLGVRLLRGNSSTFGSVGRIILLGLWIAAIATFVTLGANEIRSHRVTATKKENHPLPLKLNDTLKVQIFPIQENTTVWEFEKSNPLNNLFTRIREDRRQVSLSVKRSRESQSTLQIKASAKGSNEKRAQKKVQQVNYHWELGGDKLYLDQFISNKELSSLVHKDIALTLHLAEGQILNLDRNLNTLMQYPVKNDQGFHSRKTAGYLWKMGVEKLECLDCPPNKSKLQLEYQDADGDEKLHLKVDEDGIRLKTE